MQNVKQPTIAQLQEELRARVGALKEFEERAFSIYDVDDLSQQMTLQGTPAVAVGYEHTEPTATPNTRTMPSTDVKTSFLYTEATFSILVGVEYVPNGDTDTKPIATDLLDAVRKCLIGFKGVNGKPWRFAGERPVGGDDRGVIWYGQLWQTDVPYLSSK